MLAFNRPYGGEAATAKPLAAFSHLFFVVVLNTVNVTEARLTVLLLLLRKNNSWKRLAKTPNLTPLSRQVYATQSGTPWQGY